MLPAINNLKPFPARCTGIFRVPARAFSSARSREAAAALLISLFLSASQAHALSPDGADGQGPMTIDDLGFGHAMDSRVFASGYRVRSTMPLASPASPVGGLLGERNRMSVSTTLEFDAPATDKRLALEPGEQEVLDGVSVRRFSTALQGSSGTLTVGNDWSNFQDFLDRESPVSLSGRGLTSEQVAWASSGELGEFSVALEKNYDFLDRDRHRSFSDDPAIDSQVTSSPSLILSWQGTSADRRGLYSFSALGRELEDGDLDGSGDSTESGWGVNLAGGWHFGQLFAALSVSLGNSIDSFILGKVGDAKTASQAARVLSPAESININPSLSYRLGENANLHFALNRFATESGSAPHGIETLDTIHLGYTWAPWPSTRIGIEIVGKDVEGRGTMEDSNEVNFAASKRF